MILSSDATVGMWRVSGPWHGPGSAPPLFLAGDAPLLRADEQVFEAMLEGWSEQQRSRGLRTDTIDGRLLAVRRFQRFHRRVAMVVATC